MKKVLFWIFGIVSLIAGFYMTLIGAFANGLGLYGTGVGQIFCVLAMFSVVVSVVGVVLGIIKLRKGNMKKALLFALLGVIYAIVMIAAMFLDDAVHSVQLERDIAARNEQLYGEGWDSAPAIEGIPKLYQEALNKFYAVVRDRWPADQLMDLAAMAMPDYYGDESLDNIGFILMDVDGDGVDEMMVGTTAPVAEGGTAIFTMYSDPENPFINLHSLEGEIYYLHPGEGGTYLAEIGGMNAAWQLKDEADSNLVDIIYQEGTLDPANRLTLELTPFSQYK